jgi:hypothetical protein
MCLAVVLVALAVLPSGLGGGDEATALEYQVTAVKRKLVREQPAPEIPLEVGATPSAGQLLRTGSRSSAEIACPEYGATFRLGSKTRARLASERPGVLLEVERGSLRALFERLAGDDPPERIVTTPSAVLAVRGTEYGVEVSSKGDTGVTVFEGVVDVTDIGGVGPPVRVQAGQYCTIRRGRAAGRPEPHGMSPGDWDRGRRPDDRAFRGPSDEMGGMGSDGMGRSGSQGSSGSDSRRPHGGSRGPGG